MRYSYSSGGDSLWTLIICVILICAIAFGTNACSARDWNDGICPRCHVRYELRSVYRGLRYYACPNCGQEVERYLW